MVCAKETLPRGLRPLGIPINRTALTERFGGGTTDPVLAALNQVLIVDGKPYLLSKKEEPPRAPSVRTVK